MRRLVWLLVLAALIWSGYWAAGWYGLEQGGAHWLELRRAEGWQAEVSEITTTGFPTRFVTQVDGLDLVDPETGLGWEAPERLPWSRRRSSVSRNLRNCYKCPLQTRRTPSTSTALARGGAAR